MGATTNEIFGTTPASELATPGSYGERPSGYRLPDATRQTWKDASGIEICVSISRAKFRSSGGFTPGSSKK